MSEVLVLFYSRGGHTRALAEQIRFGIETHPNTRARLRTVAPLHAASDDIPDAGPPYAEKSDFRECDALALGSPTRFGTMAAPLKAFLEKTSDLWLSGTMINKPAAVFTSTSSLHGGQEATLLSMSLPLLHHGMMLLGVPYSEAQLMDTQSGGSPYGPLALCRRAKTIVRSAAAKSRLHARSAIAWHRPQHAMPQCTGKLNLQHFPPAAIPAPAAR